MPRDAPRLDAPRLDARGVAVRVALVLGAAGVLVAHARAYLPFLSDDALISLRYAARLLGGHGLTWTPGPAVEGYSNALWVLLVALLGASGVDLVDAARGLGVAGVLAVVGWIGWEYGRPRAGGLAGAAVGLLVVVSAAPVAVWAVGGLEQPLVAALLAGVFPLYWRAAEGGFLDRRLAAGLAALLGALCLTRPDGPLFAAALLAALALGHERPDRRRALAFAAVLLAGPALCVAAQLAFRLAVYGAWVPNTALVKLDPTPHHALGGLRYVLGGAWALAPASLLAAAAVGVGLARRATRARFLPLATVGALWAAYVVAIGGDIFPAHRHLVPLVVVAAYALAEASADAWARGSRRAVAAAALAVALGAIVQSRHPQNVRAADERWEWQGRALALTLRAAFADCDPLLGVTAAGALPYWSGFRSLDLLGLNDAYLPRHRPPGAGSGFLGHELGDGAYLLQRAPDVVVFTVGGPPQFRYAEAFGPGGPLAADFAAAYAAMPVRTATAPRYDAVVWFRRDSPALGVERSADRVRVPAHLLDAFAHSTATLHGGRLVVAVEPGRPAGVDVPGLRGDWRAEAVSSGSVVATVARAGGGVRVVVSAHGTAPVLVEAVVLTRAARATL